MNISPEMPQLGARPDPAGGVRFRVWAPGADRVELVLSGAAGEQRVTLSPEERGYHTVHLPGVRPGARYRYLVNGAGPYPDPCSRFQPDGPHGASAVVDPSAFRWTDGRWSGPRPERHVIYELHTGAFTAEGTFEAIIPELARLVRLGVTAIELMPVAEFPGRWNWGYDGVGLFAPAHVYGGPDGLRRLVDAAHAAGLAVLLDVVYNHLGPDGNYLRAFSPDYFTDRHHTPWGDALNYDGAGSRGVRDFICAAACHWVQEYHLDGLRLDAVHATFDDSPVQIVAELTERVRAAAGARSVLVIAESDENDVRLIRPRAAGGAATPPANGDGSGLGLDGVWADDFHHAVRVRLSGEQDGYYAAYTGSSEEIATAVASGFIYQGQTVPHTGRPRGTRVTDEPAAAFVFCLQNHDQVGNRAEGERLPALADAGAIGAATALLLLAPETPLLFMGQEYGATTPFLYFTDHHEELGRLVTEGRRQEFASFAAFRDPKRRARIPDPQAESTFLRSKLDPRERAANAHIERLHRDLLALRRDDPVLSVADRAALRATAPSADVVVVQRWQGAAQRLLLVNFGAATQLPWTALNLGDAARAERQLLWYSTAAVYGGSGIDPTLTAEAICLLEHSAVLLRLGS